MVGITSAAVYIPMYRLSGKEIGRMWQARGRNTQKAVAGYDEDSVTLAVAAAQACMSGVDAKPQGLYFATTSAPYVEKQSATIIANAIDLKRQCHTVDFANSLRSGTSAMKSAIDGVRSGSTEAVLVAASDCRLGAPGGMFEQTLGDGAAALMIGSENVMATIEGSHSISSDFTDSWRKTGEVFLQSGETRFIEEKGYTPILQEAVSAVMKQHSLTPADFARAVFPAPNDRLHAGMAEKLGFDKGRIQETLYKEIGHTGSAAALIMLVAALEQAKPGDRILFANYGDGCDAFILRVTEDISRLQARKAMSRHISNTVSIDYGTYLKWRELMPLEPPSLPERTEPSLAARWREHGAVSALYGSRCKQCGTPQIHPLGQNLRVCVNCQSKDDFEPYRFSDKKGKIFTYAVDILQPTRNPPGLNGVIDFEGGGRLICEMTDYDLQKVAVGMPVEMTFRKLSRGKGPVNYFWKAKPITSQASEGEDGA